MNPLQKLGREASIILVLALVALAFIGIAVSGWRHFHNAKTEARLQQAQSGAVVESAKDAIQTQGNVAAAQAAGEDLTRSNEKEIRDAKGSDQTVDPAARDAGLRSLCRRPAYRGSERCLRFAPAAGLEAGRRAR